ncbi:MULTISPECIES: TetR/AcrR family transcriptional regulator [unclassified Cupriavidus]|uniref:TetR/AcrR family transcriptional regulator n=1 Tax=unclassified Cupriavidus TaxID=2640874 RepID=UPI0010FA0839|nr:MULTISPECIES: TetR/AcrR family transcriptional regulator [unclassified Cupriavidus]MWL89464.1 TetR family transcriptional regulator [Cupriavidus sp. SW-Y-13]
MQKGQLTRSAIIEQALQSATKVGFEQLSLATLAADTNMSKSGLYAHFRSKEALQEAVLVRAMERFSEIVIQPAMREPRGTGRLEKLFDGYMAWLSGTVIEGGCVFMALSQEYRDRPGVIRDNVVQAFKDWHSTIVRVVLDAVDEGDLRQDTDPRQFAFEMAGIGMSFQSSLRLMGRGDAAGMARKAFGRLVNDVRENCPGSPARAE